MDGLLSIFKQPTDKSCENQSSRFYDPLMKAEWNVVLESNTFQDVLRSDPKDVNVSNEELLHLAIASLLAFVQQNFLGPDLDLGPRQNETSPDTRDILMQLKSDGEELNINVECAECLLVCRKVFDQLIPSNDLAVRIWYQRYLLIYQRCVDELTYNLYSRFNENAKFLESALESVEKVNRIEVYLEIVLGYVQFKRITKSEHWLQKLETISNVHFTTEGQLGMRTKFQKHPLPQLTLHAKGFDELGLSDASETHGHVHLPTLLKLEDDVRLDKVTFFNDSENVDIQLPALIQNMVLAKLYFLYVSQPNEQLALEEFRPYITSLVYQQFGPWATRVAALFLNATTEATHKRTVDRSLRQIEELVKQVSGKCVPTITDRISMAFSSWVIPRWKMKEKLADVMVSLGMIKSALDVYLSVHCWESVIDCYMALELRHQAAMVIRQLIEKNGPSVKLYCMLGDAADDVEYYQQAWDFSGETSARAQRHWGNFYFARKDYANAIDHLRRSIDINCMQEPTLLRLGYSALQLERWEEAAHAYRLYTSFESHGFESWNNLAKVYVKLGEKVRAHKILQEALKCNYNNWMVWENYLIVSVDTRYFDDALIAYERLMELKDKYYDRQVLDIVVRAIATGETDASGQSCGRLKKKAIKLLGHACAQRANDGYLYALAAELEDEDLLRRCQKLQNAYRGYTQSNSQWSKVPESCLTVVNLCVQLCEYSLKALLEGKDKDRFIVIRSQIASTRLTGQACLRSAKNEEWDQCVAPVNVLEELVREINSELTATLESMDLTPM